MMGRVQHQSATSDEDRYRCFAYEKVQVSSVQHGTGGSPTDRQHRSPMILLAQSGDATCSGLTSPTEGSRTLKLTKGMCALSLSLYLIFNQSTAPSCATVRLICHTTFLFMCHCDEKKGDRFNKAMPHKEEEEDGMKELKGIPIFELSLSAFSRSLVKGLKDGSSRLIRGL